MTDRQSLEKYVDPWDPTKPNLPKGMEQTLGVPTPSESLYDLMLNGTLAKTLKDVSQNSRHAKRWIETLSARQFDRAAIAGLLMTLHSHTVTFLGCSYGLEIKKEAAIKGILLAEDTAEEYALVPARTPSTSSIWAAVDSLISQEYITLVDTIVVRGVTFTILRLGYA